jgi:hypothetical protein
MMVTNQEEKTTNRNWKTAAAAKRTASRRGMV